MNRGSADRATRACERCRATREGSRFCPSCGLDFWQAAAGAGAEPAGVPSPTSPQGGVASSGGAGLSIGLLAVAAGLVLLVAAGGLWLAMGTGTPPRGPAQARNEVPASHPLILAFFAEARDPTAAYAWSQEGEVELRAFGEVTGSLLLARGRFVADDWIAAVTITEDDERSFSGDLAVIGNHVYLQEGDGGWTEGERVPTAALGPMNPFARISTVGELEYVGPERRNGVDGHIVRTDKWLSDPEMDDPVRRVAHMTVRESLMEIHVDDAGVPLSAVHTFTIEARTPDGEDVVLTGRTRYVFRDWGAIEPIVPPTPNPEATGP